ncbi:di-heme oxidoredictase family protein [Vibrio coralliilyticus]|uniref:di-heme oxidoredictase family protein n=1 Tax=Vibrio coralliilyticus TaxID=190893 RepID=UPI0018213465|nr:di-heme oxidoredictase family protein [Vibrio coralliilyticus]NUW67110.1 c-type cytochrome [Vibrio coralliilyticus]
MNDFNNFNIEYWFGRFGYIELKDYTHPAHASERMAKCNTNEPCVVVDLYSQVPQAMVDVFGNEKDCNQQVPNWRYHKDYGNETNFLYGYVMDIVSSDGRSIPACQATRQQRKNAQHWRAVMRRWQHISRPFEYGAQIEFETTISFDRAQITGDNVNYYGQTFRYVLGKGFTINNQDRAVGPVGVNDELATLGGETTLPVLAQTGGEQTRLAFMQHAYNISQENIADWLAGRRLFHTDFATGAHKEPLLPGPQAQPGNLPFPEQANKATNPIQASCVDCHTLNGVGELQSRQEVVPPKLIGLGLLERIPEGTLYAWAQGNGGTVNQITVNGQRKVGRFGWRAEATSVKHQVAKALHEDMGVGTDFDVFGPAEISSQELAQMSVYSSLLAVPVARKNLVSHSGYQVFRQANCDVCHKPTAVTEYDAQFPELSQQTIHPFTDLLLHDLGEGMYRTAPLWGLGLTGLVRTGNTNDLTLMHDGKATSIEEAVLRHNGSGAQSRDRYRRLSHQQRSELIDFLMSL